MQRARSWETRFGQKAAGRTLAIIGLGSIGMEVARRAHAFDMRVIAVRRHPQRHEDPPFVDRVSGPDGLHDMLAEADAVVVSAAATDETRRVVRPTRTRAVLRGSP